MKSNILNIEVKQSQLISIRSIDNEDANYVQISELDIHDKAAVSHDLAIERLYKENRIYLRAALQLLDAKSNINHHQYSSKKGCNLTDTSAHHVDFDVFRYGKLKKATRSSTFNVISPLWKSKYVEVRYGKFTYDDENKSSFKLRMSVNSAISTTSSGDNNSQIDMLKHITLNSSVICQPYKIKSSVASIYSDCVFEISHAGECKRLFLASSVDERDAWIDTINAAIPAPCTDYLKNSNSGSSTSAAGGKIVGNKQSNRSNSSRSNICINNGDYSSLYLEGSGPSLPYAAEISQFNLIRSIAYNTAQAGGIVKLLNKLRIDKVILEVPVFYVKSLCQRNSNNFTISTQDILSSHTLKSVDTSQLWKDMQRDVVCINGDTIKGELGADMIIGCLLRQIMDKADMVKRLKSMGRDHGNTCSNVVDSQDSSDSVFDLTEAQALCFAKELLCLCNRTQSGGDAYYCCDSLFIDTDRGNAILVPHSLESDPLNITVDIIDMMSLVTNKNSNNSYNSSTKSGAYNSSYVDDIHSSSNSIINSNRKSTNAIKATMKSLLRLSGKKAKNTSQQQQQHDQQHNNDSDDNSRNDTGSDCQYNNSEDGNSSYDVGVIDQCHGNEDAADLFHQLTNNTDKHKSNILNKSKNSNSSMTLSTTHRIPNKLIIGLDDTGNVMIDTSPPMTAESATTTTAAVSLYDVGVSTCINTTQSKSSIVTSSALAWEEASVISDLTQDSSVITRTPSSIHTRIINRQKANTINVDKVYIPHAVGQASESSGRTTTGNNSSHGSNHNDGGYATIKRSHSFNEIRDSAECLLTPKQDKNFDNRIKYNGSSRTSLSNPYMCIRVQVNAVSHYRLCNSNPQGDGNDNYGVISAVFRQSFFLRGGNDGKPYISDRLVSIKVID